MAVNRTSKVGIVIGVNVLLAAIWWLVPLWMYGVFDDGMFYGSIARNLVYDAQATIWDLKVSNTLDPQFNGHPPLSFWLQALFFWVLGDVYWVERVYSLFLALCTMGLLVACWRLFEIKGSRLALLFWLTISIVGWSFGNNVLENLLTVCTLAAVYCLVLAARRTTYQWLFVALGAIGIGAAVLTKGPVGLYPLAVPLGYAFLLESARWKRAFVETVLLVFFLVAGYFLLITTVPRAALFLERYWDLQLMGSLTGQDSLAPHRFYILQALLEEFLPALIIGLVLHGGVSYFKLSTIVRNKKAILFCLWVALCASLPLLISPKQLRFYIVPAMGWYALAWGLFCWPAFLVLVEYSRGRWKRTRLFFQGLLGVGLISCIIMSGLNQGGNARQEALLSDTRTIGTLLLPHQEIQISYSLFKRWSLHGYFYRYYYIDLNTVYKEQTYILVPKGEGLTRSNYRKKELDLEVLELYELMVE